MFMLIEQFLTYLWFGRYLYPASAVGWFGVFYEIWKHNFIHGLPVKGSHLGWKKEKKCIALQLTYMRA